MLSIVLMFVAAIYFPGIIVKSKAIFSGRKGPGIVQPWRDILRLMRKGNVFSSASSYVFQLSSTIYLTATLAALLFIPFLDQAPLISFTGDFVLFAYLLALGRFAIVASALDVSSGFEGMGANREVLYGLLIEPAFFILMGSLAMFTGHASFASIFQELHYTSYFAAMIGFIAAFILSQITLVETSRLPVDDPLTHLELTMVHEVMVLDHSGIDLGIIKAANNLKFSIFGMLSANCIVPRTFGLWEEILFYLVLQAGFAVGIGFIESFRARNKMAMNPQFILSVSAIASILIFVVMIINNNL
jgi:formate hydrogenlyase subunit 4